MANYYPYFVKINTIKQPTRSAKSATYHTVQNKSEVTLEAYNNHAMSTWKVWSLKEKLVLWIQHVDLAHFPERQFPCISPQAYSLETSMLAHKRGSLKVYLHKWKLKQHLYQKFVNAVRQDIARLSVREIREMLKSLKTEILRRLI